MADFNQFFPILLRNEGGYANIPGDSGGETYEGISRNNYPSWAGWAIVDAHKPLKWNQVIQDTTLQGLVISFYKPKFWDNIGGDQINSQSVANFIGDWGVNSGDSIPIKHTQLILKIPTDGKVGPQTIAAINRADAESLFNNLKSARIAFYNAVVANNPGDEKFLNEWIERTNSFVFNS